MPNRRPLTRALVAALVTVLAAVGLAVVAASPAQASWTDYVAYRRQGSVCSSDGTNLTVGASVYQKEIGKHGVRQMRVKFLLYTTDPNSAGIHVAWLNKTKYSGTFPNDETSYWWNGGKGATQTWTFTAESGEYWMVAKLTWDRGARRDWNYKLPVAYCSWSPAAAAGVQP